MSKEKQIEEMARFCCNTCEMFTHNKVGANKFPCAMDNDYKSCHLCIETAEHLYNAGYRKQEWFDAKNHPPTESGKYIVCSKGENVFQAKFYAHPNGAGGQWGSKNKGKNIVRWTYMPDAPKGQK